MCLRACVRASKQDVYNARAHAMLQYIHIVIITTIKDKTTRHVFRVKKNSIIINYYIIFKKMFRYYFLYYYFLYLPCGVSHIIKSDRSNSQNII